jgi:putative oxidoreductase
VRRLFWTFATGVPGAGLLVMRVVAAAALASRVISGLSGQLEIGSVTLSVLQPCAGLFLLVGLWTPLAGLLAVVLEGWQLWSQAQDLWTTILTATLCGALALLGPGAWSVDAWLFGWKRINIKDRQTGVDTTAEPESER